MGGAVQGRNGKPVCPPWTACGAGSHSQVSELSSDRLSAFAQAHSAEPGPHIHPQACICSPRGLQGPSVSRGWASPGRGRGRDEKAGPGVRPHRLGHCSKPQHPPVKRGGRHCTQEASHPDLLRVGSATGLSEASPLPEPLPEPHPSYPRPYLCPLPSTRWSRHTDSKKTLGTKPF